MTLSQPPRRQGSFVVWGGGDEVLILVQQWRAAGNHGGAVEAARIHRGLGHFEEAVVWYGRAAETEGVASGMRAQKLPEDGRKGVQKWYFSIGISGVEKEAAEMFREAGRIEEALDWLKSRALAGNRSAHEEAVLGFLEAGSVEDALDLLQQADYFSSHTLREAMRRLREMGRIEEALVWLKKQLEHDTPWKVFYPAEVGRVLRESGRADEALEWFIEQVEVGSQSAAYDAAQLLEDSGRVDEALTWYERAAADVVAEDRKGNIMASAGRMLRGAGRVDEAVVWYLRAAKEAGRPDAVSEAAATLREADRTEEALSLLQQHADADSGIAIGDPARMLTEAARLLSEAGRTDEAIAQLDRGAEVGDLDAANVRASMLREAGQIEKGLIGYRRAAEAGNSLALERAVAMLREAGRDEDAGRLQANGWEPDGSVARPWSARPQSAGHP